MEQVDRSLIKAIYASSVERVRTALACGRRPCYTELMVCVERNRAECLREILPFADGQLLDCELVWLAVDLDKYECTKILAQNGADLNGRAQVTKQIDESMTPLEVAVFRQADATSARILLDHGASNALLLNMINYACFLHNTQLLAVLLSHAPLVVNPRASVPTVRAGQMMHAHLSCDKSVTRSLRPVSRTRRRRGQMLERQLTILRVYLRADMANVHTLQCSTDERSSTL